MFVFLGGVKKHPELEHLLERTENNMANNYKDAAQEYFGEYEEKLRELTDAGRLNDKQKEHYESLLGVYKERLKGFTHKDQKPFWT